MRGEQRVNRGHRHVTGHTSGGKPYRVEGRLNIKELISRSRCRICREKGHWARECANKGNKCPDLFSGGDPVESDDSQCLFTFTKHFSFFDKHHEQLCKDVLTFVLAIIIILKQTLSKHGKQMVVRNLVVESKVFFGCEACSVSRTN